MGKTSRDKGAGGEREVVNLARARGVRAARTAQLQAGRVAGAADVELLDYPEVFVEVKRDERLSVDRMVKQARAASVEANPSRTFVVAHRRNRQPWLATLPLEQYLDLLRRAAI